MRRKGFFWIPLVLVCLTASSAWARGQINNVSLSTQILLEAYRSAQNNSSAITWINPQVLLLAVSSDKASAGLNLNFNLQVFDGNTQVLSAGPFKVTRTLALGNNIYNAGDISAQGLTITFNQNYNPQGDTSHLAAGNPMPMGNYRVLLAPVTPTPGDGYNSSLALFTPPSAMNMPPIPIYPKEIEVNSVLPNFVWTPVAKAAGYEVTVGSEPNPEGNVYWKSERLNATQALYAPSARALENGHKYYWQVRAFDSFGNPIGGVDGKSQPASFTVNSSNRVSTAVAPKDVETVFRGVITDPTIFVKLNAYEPVAIETSAADVADLLQQLKNGTAKIVAAHVE